MKRIITLMLAILMICSVGFVFASCDDNNGPTESASVKESTGENASSDDPGPTTVIDYYRNIPEGTDLGGFEFKIYSYDYIKGLEHNLYLAPDSDGGERVQAAAFLRNSYVEETYHCNIVHGEGDEDQWTTYLDNLRPQIKAGSCDYSLICFYGTTDVKISGYVQNGLLLDWNQLPVVNLSEQWYNQSANKAYSVLGKQYLAVSEITRPVQGQSAMLMNKTLYVTSGKGGNADEIYNVVQRKEWTLNKLDSLVKDTYQNTNTDNPVKDSGDTFGMTFTSNFSDGMVFATGVMPVVFQDEGFVYDFTSKKVNNVVSWLVNKCYKDPDVFFEKNTKENGYNPNAVIYKIFQDGRSLFSFYASDPSALRSYTFDYAYLPYPMQNASQGGYNSVGTCGVMGIPYPLNADIGAVGVVIEAMSAGSRERVFSAFIDDYFETRILRDPQSKEIYQMLANNTTYLISSYLDPGGVTGYFGYFTESNVSNTTSRWKKQSPVIEKAYKNLLTAVKTLDH